jgi:hypothetical protein
MPGVPDKYAAVPDAGLKAGTPRAAVRHSAAKRLPTLADVPGFS